MRFLLLLSALSAFAQTIDLSKATIVATSSLGPRGQRYARLLQEEVEMRTGLRLQIGAATVSGPTITLAKTSGAPESFRLETNANGATISGANDRGLLFGVGKLLRQLEMRRQQVRVATGLRFEEKPEIALRGHQLGYRPKTNSYDAWDLEQWRHYIQELAVFGTNTVELIPPRSDDDPDSPHFPIPQMEMMVGMSRVLDELDMDVWIWYPALDPDYSRQADVDFAIKEWAEVFRKLPRVDAILVPAGDPGHTPARPLMAFLEKQAANLRKFHPKATLWVAPQGFDAKQIEEFFTLVNQKPAWLAGLVYGPQSRLTLQQLRERTPAQYPIRSYPDITHSRQSQFPVNDWDAGFALSEGRETINPRPLHQANLVRYHKPHTLGFITYSEGCNDDVNKIVWSATAWNGTQPTIDILREYSRFFISPDHAESFAQGLMSLERNWVGAAANNPGIDVTFQQFQSMEAAALPKLKANWRFQQAVYRAYYDAFIRARSIAEANAETQAINQLRANASNPAAAMHLAEQALHIPAAAPHLRQRLSELAEALFQSIRMQLSVPKYQGQPGRGNNLDSADVPLNSAPWLRDQFTKIRALPTKEQSAALGRIANWTNPGPGGFYDDLGNPELQPHLVPGVGVDKDPAFFATPLAFFNQNQTGPRSWWTHTLGLYEYTVKLRYPELAKDARYRVRVVYGAGPVKLVANGTPIHDFVEKPYEVLEYDVPAEATRAGSLTLEFSRPPGIGGAGRGNQIAEVWLIRQP